VRITDFSQSTFGADLSKGKRVRIIQGEYYVTGDPEVSVSTVLGSCVAACIRDPISNVGGMNHFLLPGDVARNVGQEAERAAVHLMELLLNDLFKRGAQRNHLEAKLFGGARMFANLTDIGSKNSAFAESFLKHEGVRVVSGSVGGQHGRQVEYWPVSGRARAMMIKGDPARVQERVPVKAPAPSSSGELELF
jgi:chemotaxis protein CheD